MSELIYCCPNCLTVASTGIHIGAQETLDRIQCRPILIKCPSCRIYVGVSVSNTMVSASLNDAGEFRSFALAE